MIAGAALGLVLTAAQIHWLNVAYDEGAKYGIPRYTQAVVLAESSACLHLRGDDGRSWGCGQLQVQTARSVCGCKFTARVLENENGSNLRLTAQYLSACFKRFWPDKERALYCYNAGIPSASKASARQVRQSRYVKRVEMFVKQLQKIPVSHD